MAFYIEFWQGTERIAEYEEDGYPSMFEAREHIEDLLREMMTDTWAEDWTGCRFEVTGSDGRTVLQVPILPAMRALARRNSH
jgi:hypothetical protein